MKVYVASITLDYNDEYGESLRYEITKVFSTEEKAKAFISIGNDEEEMGLLWQEEIKSSNCLFDTDKLDEVLAFGIEQKEVL